MTKKRFAKLSRVRELVEATKRFGAKDSNIGVLTWGSSAGPALEAVSLLQQKGQEVSGMAIRLLSPFPMDEVLAFVNGCKTVLIAEVNYQGQLSSLIEGRQSQGTIIRKFTSVEGVPFRAGQIAAALEEVVRQ
jgi:2-oxoglutarate ferredoxin oxidoreductase subunit alpha